MHVAKIVQGLVRGLFAHARVHHGCSHPRPRGDRGVAEALDTFGDALWEGFAPMLVHGATAAGATHALRCFACVPAAKIWSSATGECLLTLAGHTRSTKGFRMSVLLLAMRWKLVWSARQAPIGLGAPVTILPMHIAALITSYNIR